MRALRPQSRPLLQDPTLPRLGGGGGTCKYVLKMCLAERVMSSPMPIFYEGSKREILAPGLQPGPTVSRPSLSTTHVDVVQLVSGRAPEH